MLTLTDANDANLYQISQHNFNDKQKKIDTINVALNIEKTTTRTLLSETFQVLINKDGGTHSIEVPIQSTVGELKLLALGANIIDNVKTYDFELNGQPLDNSWQLRDTGLTPETSIFVVRNNCHQFDPVTAGSEWTIWPQSKASSTPSDFGSIPDSIIYSKMILKPYSGVYEFKIKVTKFNCCFAVGILARTSQGEKTRDITELAGSFVMSNLGYVQYTDNDKQRWWEPDYYRMATGQGRTVPGEVKHSESIIDEGDIINVYVDMDEMVLEFGKNNERLGIVAHTDIPRVQYVFAVGTQFKHSQSESIGGSSFVNETITIQIV